MPVLHHEADHVDRRPTVRLGEGHVAVAVRAHGAQVVLAREALRAWPPGEVPEVASEEELHVVRDFLPGVAHGLERAPRRFLHEAHDRVRVVTGQTVPGKASARVAEGSRIFLPRPVGRPAMRVHRLMVQIEGELTEGIFREMREPSGTPSLHHGVQRCSAERMVPVFPEVGRVVLGEIRRGGFHE